VKQTDGAIVRGVEGGRGERERDRGSERGARRHHRRWRGILGKGVPAMLSRA